MAASRVACASFNIGTNTTITITRDSSSYTHTITYKFGSATGTIATKTTQTSIVWSPAAATLYAQIPNSVSGYGTITCQTYNGNTLIGTTTAGFYAYAVKANCLPAVSAAIVDTNAAATAVTGSNAKLVRYISKPKVTITATAKNSASLKAYQVYNPVGLTGTTNPYTFDTVYSKEFRIKAVDSRGYYTEITQEVGFVEYDPAYFNSVTLKRTESTSTTATAALKGYCFKGNFGAADNTLAIKYRFKTASGNYGSYVSISGATWNTDGTFSVTTNITGLSLSETYTFEFVVEDKLSSFVNDEIILSPASGDMRIGKDYVQFKNNLFVGDKNNTEWRALQVRRKVNGKSFDGSVGMGGANNLGVLALELRQNEEVTGRMELRNDGHLYNYYSSMSLAEIMSSAPSTVVGGAQGHLLLNGGDSATPILIQWGRVSITPTAPNTVATLNVNFAQQYVGNPFVTLGPATSIPASANATVGNITANGFAIHLQRTTTDSAAILWVAIGNGSNALPE